MAFIPLSNIHVEIQYNGPETKREFVLLFYNTNIKTGVGLLFPSNSQGHDNEIPKWSTLTEALEGATQWEWNFAK